MVVVFIRWSFAILAVVFVAFPTIKYLFYSIFFSERDVDIANAGLEILCGFMFSAMALLIVLFSYI